MLSQILHPHLKNYQFICNNGKKHKIKRNFFVPLILVVARKHNKKIPKKLIALPNPIFVRKHI
jgi:hypothetical protein